MKWQTVPVAEIAKQVRGVSYDKSQVSSNPSQGLIPILRAGNIQDGSLLLNNDLVFAPESCVSSQQLLRPCDIVIAASSGSLDVVGKAAQVEYQWQGSFGAFCKVVRPTSDRIDPRYLHHYFQSSGYRRKVSSLAAGANINNLKNEHIDDLEIPLPPLEEQRRIAAILDKAAELETLLLKQSRLLEDAEKHLFLEYLGSPFPGKTPWPVAQLGELGSLERGISKHRPRNDPSLMDGPYPFIQTGDVAGCRGKLTTFSATYSEKGLAQSRLWPAGTLCITIAANIAKTGILDFDACFPDSVVGFQAKNPAIITYVQCWMSFLQGHIEQMAPESAQKNINLEILRGLSVPVPSDTVLKKFHVAILALRCTWSRSTQRRRRTSELKSSLQSESFAA